jgi:hypothetical protein
MLKELDVVRAKINLSEKVKKDALGAVVVIFSDFPNNYMVEFMENGEMLDVLTVNEENIEKIDY